MKKLSILLLIALCACSTIEGKTPGQKFFGLKQDYKTLLTAAVEYKEICEEHPTENCLGTVKKIQGVDNKIFTIINVGDAILDGYTSGDISTVVTDLSKAVTEFRDLVSDRSFK